MQSGHWLSRSFDDGCAYSSNRTPRARRDNSSPAAMLCACGGSGPRPHRFWEKAYQDNLTGLAGMVAYNLLLSVFPVALIALFIAGQILASPELEQSVLEDLQDLPPRATETTLTEALREVRESSTTAGIIALVASLWVATSFWGALDTAFCRIYALPCRSWVRQKLFGLGMLGLVLLFFAATVAMPALQSLLFSHKDDLPFGLSDRDALYTITLGAGFVVTFFALPPTIYRTVPNTSVPWHGVWPGALGGDLAIGLIDYGFPFYLTNVSAFAGLRTTLVFVLIVLIWFYVLALIILAGGGGQRAAAGGAATGYPRGRARSEDRGAPPRADRAGAPEQVPAPPQADEEPETEQHERRADRAGYLREKLEERAEAEDAAAREEVAWRATRSARRGGVRARRHGGAVRLARRGHRGREGRLGAEEAGRRRARRASGGGRRGRRRRGRRRRRDRGRRTARRRRGRARGPHRSASPVTQPIRAAPGCRRASSSTAASACAAGTTAQKPQPMLKTSHISASPTSASSCTRSKTAGTGSGASISKPTSACSRSRFSSPPPVMCASPRTSTSGAQQLEHRAHVDHRRLEQRVGHRRPAQHRRPVVEAEPSSAARASE